MTKAEREMVLFLMHAGGTDYCQKCIHLNKESCGCYVSPKDYGGECNIDYCIAGMIEYFERLRRPFVELPYKVGDTVYSVGNFDCAQVHTEDEKLQRRIYLHCVKLGGDCDRCKYATPKIEEFECTHIQISKEGMLVCGKDCQGYYSDRIFVDKTQAETRLKELQGVRNDRKRIKSNVGSVKQD